MNRTVLLVVLLCGCASTRALAPVGKGNVALTGSLGGPILSYSGAPVPLPITSIGGVYGVGDLTNVHASLYPTGLALFGLFGVDAGLSRQVLAQAHARPRVMLDVTAYAFYGNEGKGDPKGGFRVFPDVSAVAAWDTGPKVTLFAGLDVFTQIGPATAYPSPFVGTELRTSKHFGFEAQVLWEEMWRDGDPYVLDWYGVGGNGALALQLGFNVYLGEGK